MELTFEAWPGTLGSVAGTPDRRPGSVRRTTSIHSTPSGTGLRLEARGRDVITDRSGAGSVTDQVVVEVEAEGPLSTVRSIVAAPATVDLGPLVGANLMMSGFRRVVAADAPVPAGSVVALLLDDLPGATLVSGSARIRAAIETDGGVPGFAEAELPVVCIATRPAGVMARRRREGRPLLGQGPPAGVLERPDDPLAWPAQPELPAHGMRRLRRIDVAVADGVIHVDTHFRDSHRESSGVETAVHEYEVLVTAGREDRVIQTVEVRPRVLPGPDCPAAAASAQAVVGQRLDDLRRFARTGLRGDHTCTHLNDQLRSLADVPVLVAALRRSGLA